MPRSDVSSYTSNIGTSTYVCACLVSNDALCLLTIYDCDDGSGKTDMPPFEAAPQSRLLCGWTLASMCRPQFAHILWALLTWHQYTHLRDDVLCVRRSQSTNKPTPYSTAAGSSMKPSQLNEYYYYHSSEIIIKQQTYSIMRQWGMCVQSIYLYYIVRMYRHRLLVYRLC